MTKKKEMFNKRMKDVAQRFITLLEIIPPDEYYATFLGSVLVLRSSSPFFSNKAAPGVRAKYVMIHLADTPCWVNYVSANGHSVIHQACYGKPQNNNDPLKKQLASMVKIEIFHQCKLTRLTDSLCKMYYGLCYYQEEWYLYIDTIFDSNSDQSHIMACCKMNEVLKLGMSRYVANLLFCRFKK